jgi:hypothetical protein
MSNPISWICAPLAVLALALRVFGNNVDHRSHGSTHRIFCRALHVRHTSTGDDMLQGRLCSWTLMPATCAMSGKRREGQRWTVRIKRGLRRCRAPPRKRWRREGRAAPSVGRAACAPTMSRSGQCQRLCRVRAAQPAARRRRRARWPLQSGPASEVGRESTPYAAAAASAVKRSHNRGPSARTGHLPAGSLPTALGAGARKDSCRCRQTGSAPPAPPSPRSSGQTRACTRPLRHPPACGVPLRAPAGPPAGASAAGAGGGRSGAAHCEDAAPTSAGCEPTERLVQAPLPGAPHAREPACQWPHASAPWTEPPAAAASPSAWPPHAQRPPLRPVPQQGRRWGCSQRMVGGGHRAVGQLTRQQALWQHP